MLLFGLLLFLFLAGAVLVMMGAALSAGRPDPMAVPMLLAGAACFLLGLLVWLGESA